MRIRGCEFPEDRLYHPEFNIWIQHSAPGVVTLGATSFGAALAVEFVAFVPKPLGTEIDPGRAAALLELSKTMVSVRSPLKGRIIEHNAAAVADPTLISSDPYGAGWLVRLTVEKDGDKAALIGGAAIRPAFEAAMDLDDFRRDLS